MDQNSSKFLRVFNRLVDQSNPNIEKEIKIGKIIVSEGKNFIIDNFRPINQQPFIKKYSWQIPPNEIFEIDTHQVNMNLDDIIYDEQYLEEINDATLVYLTRRLSSDENNEIRKMEVNDGIFHKQFTINKLNGNVFLVSDTRDMGKIVATDQHLYVKSINDINLRLSTDISIENIADEDMIEEYIDKFQPDQNVNFYRVIPRIGQAFIFKTDSRYGSTGKTIHKYYVLRKNVHKYEPMSFEAVSLPYDGIFAKIANYFSPFLVQNIIFSTRNNYVTYSHDDATTEIAMKDKTNDFIELGWNTLSTNNWIYELNLNIELNIYDFKTQWYLNPTNVKSEYGILEFYFFDKIYTRDVESLDSGKISDEEDLFNLEKLKIIKYVAKQVTDMLKWELTFHDSVLGKFQLVVEKKHMNVFAEFSFGAGDYFHQISNFV